MARYKLVRTCYACPEQYDVFDGEVQVGYLRLRHGAFRAEVVPSDEVVYDVSTKGDGMFEDRERVFHLNAACRAIRDRIESRGSDESEPIYDVVDHPRYSEPESP